MLKWNLFYKFYSQIIEEESLLRILCQYYCSNDLYIPPRLPGTDLPPAFKRFYDEIYHEVETELERVDHEELSLFQLNVDKKMKKRKNNMAE